MSIVTYSFGKLSELIRLEKLRQQIEQNFDIKFAKQNRNLNWKRKREREEEKCADDKTSNSIQWH